ncbi:hypothetical protein HK102_009390, partial [Quaeritorhiza haematococci]
MQVIEIELKREEVQNNSKKPVVTPQSPASLVAAASPVATVPRITPLPTPPTPPTSPTPTPVTHIIVDFIHKALRIGDPQTHKTQMKYFWVAYRKWKPNGLEVSKSMFFKELRMKLNQMTGVRRCKVRMEGVKNSSDGYSG